MSDMSNREGDPLSQFESEPKGWLGAPLRIAESADLSNDALFPFLSERDAVADDPVPAHTVRPGPGPAETNVPGPANAGRFRRPLPDLSFDLLALGRALSAGLTADRRRSAQASQVLLIATASVAIAGVLPWLRTGHVETPPETTSIALAGGSIEVQPLPTQVLSTNAAGPAVLPATPFTAAVNPVNPTVSAPVVLTRLPTAPLPAEAASPASSVKKGVDPVPSARVSQPAIPSTRLPQVTSRAAVATGFHGSLAVTSSPQGARVRLNGVLVGVTPLLLADLPIGSRAVRIELDGHKPWSSVVRIVANEPTTAAAELQPSEDQ